MNLSTYKAMHFEIIENENGFYSLEPVWNDLLSHSGSDSIFSTFEWNSTYWDHFKQNSRLRIYVFYKNGKVVGILPLMLRRTELFRELTVLAAGNRDYEDFIILPEFQQEIFTQFFSSIYAQNDWDVLAINRLREDSPNFVFLRDHCSNHNGFHSKISGITAVIPIDRPWPSYVKNLPKAIRSDPARQMRRLKETLKEVEYKNITDIQQIQVLFDKLVDFHRLRRREEGNRSVFRDSRKLAFHESIINRLQEKGWLHFSALTSGEYILALHYGFLYHGIYYYFVPVFNCDFSNYSVGKILMTSLLEQSFNRKDTAFDLLFGDEDYKRMLNPVIRNLYSFSYFRPSVAGRLASWWWIEFRPRIKSVSGHIKPVFKQLTTLK